MNIGILTFHSARNYGAVLQCYALQRYLKDNGHQVCVIDYNNETILRPYSVFSLRRIISKNPLKMAIRLYNEFRFFKSRFRRKRAFDNFIRNEVNLGNVSLIETSKLDLILVGSDQVWNFKLTGGFDPYYWGVFKKKKVPIIASYAASMMDSWDQKYSKDISSRLGNFEFVSVRENSIADKLSSLSNKKISVVVDPTLLLSKEQWSELANDNSFANMHYLLLYQVDDNNKNAIIAHQIANDLGLQVKVLSAREDAFNSKGLREASPYDFISIFKYASFIVSSSFHGTVFSLIFNKPFVSIRSGKNNESRVETLLGYFNLQHLFISRYDSENLKNYIGSNNIDLNSVVSNSKNFLQIVTASFDND